MTAGVKLGGMGDRPLETETGDISSDSLCTPRFIWEPLFELWPKHGIVCDPCSNEHAEVPAKIRYTEQSMPSGLWAPWGTTTYQNHPYSDNMPWIDKACDEMRIGTVSELVILCMSATSTWWWNKAMLKPKRNPRVICTNRIPFNGPGGVPLASGARFDTSLIYYGSKPDKFMRLFAHVTRWATWGR